MRRLSRLFTAFIAASLCVQSAAAQSILRDAETEALLADMSAPLIRAATQTENQACVRSGALRFGALRKADASQEDE